MPTPSPGRVHNRLRLRVAEITARTDAVALRLLDEEYRDLARAMAAELARLRPSPIEKADAAEWAAGILDALARANFLYDRESSPHRTARELADAAGVGVGVMWARAGVICAELPVLPGDPLWTRPSHLIENPLAWLIVVDGAPMDARTAPRQIQQAAFEAGEIPFIPDTGEPGSGMPDDGAGGGDDPMAGVRAVIQRTLDAHPEATIDELNARLDTAMALYNAEPQEALGGLSPDEMHRLITADWLEGAVQLREDIPIGELDDASTVRHARLLLALLAERGALKLTQKGNLQRAVIQALLPQLDPLPFFDEPYTYFPQRNEDDVPALRIAHTLLKVARLVRRVKGSLRLTKRGAALAAPERAGALFALLVRTHFRQLNLAWLDAARDSPSLQPLIAYTLYRFGTLTPAWRTPGEMTAALLIPSTRRELQPPPWMPDFDEAGLVLQTRMLQPLVRFGLSEGRAGRRDDPRGYERDSFRRTPLFERLFAFDLAGPHVESPTGRAESPAHSGRPVRSGPNSVDLRLLQ